MRHAIATGLSILLLGLASAAAPAATGDFDDNWTVRVVTERGKCDCTSSYDVRVARGKVLYTSYSSLSMYGTVSPPCASPSGISTTAPTAAAVSASAAAPADGAGSARTAPGPAALGRGPALKTKTRRPRHAGSVRIELRQRGASSITIWRPSKRGSDSILAIGAVSSFTRLSSL
jgi:hypothetical protein